MKQMPIIVTTREALEIAIREMAVVIDVDNVLFEEHTEGIFKQLADAGYDLEAQGKQGVFFTKQGLFDRKLHEIYDPLGMV